ncbi:MAG: enoyl-CoA hydratase/isomerase family protein, partial [Solirubrobacteraceae bacterium]
DFPRPTVAALNGGAYGGGLEIALACDLIIAEAGSSVGFPEVKLGVFPGSGGPARVIRRIGESRAKEFMFFGDPLPVETAHAWGMINKIVEPGAALPTAMEWARRLADGSQFALEVCKRAVTAAANLPADVAIADSLELTREAFAGPDVAEGIRAFFAKEPPTFR